MPTVSIVLPTYNRAEVLPNAVDSVLQQTFEDFEFIIVDDGSTDATGEIIDSYKDERIIYIKHNTNINGSAARNTGIDRATGKYIALIDSDDCWKPTKLEKQVSALEDRGGEWIAVYCDFKQTRNSKIAEMVDNLVRRPTGIEGKEEVIDRILLRRFAHGGASTLVIKQNAVDKIDGFDEEFERSQDTEFLVRLLQHGKICYIDEVLVIKNDTGSPSPEVVSQATERFNNKFEELMKKRNIGLVEASSVQSIMIAKLYFRQGEFKKGLQELRGAKIPHYRDFFGLGFSFLKGVRKRL